MCQYQYTLHNLNPTLPQVLLTDDQQNPMSIPTKANIFRAMTWLVRDARPNDSLFFHYSGHGGQTPDLDGDEDDGYDEGTLPLSLPTNELTNPSPTSNLSPRLPPSRPHRRRRNAPHSCATPLSRRPSNLHLRLLPLRLRPRPPLHLQHTRDPQRAQPRQRSR